MLTLLPVLPLAFAATPRTETPRNWGVSVRYGPVFDISDKYIDERFGSESWEITRLDYLWSSRFLEAGMGLGFFREEGFLYSEDGRKSDEGETLLMVPVSAEVVVRADIFREQILVPFGRAGADLWLWNETWENASNTDDDDRGAGRGGWHWGAGLALRLDPLDRRSASSLAATAGIDDTFIVGEYRQTTVFHDSDQLDFSSKEATFGLKFDF